jgi:starch-binding outer membrane protein, SusD/RagB family
MKQNIRLLDIYSLLVIGLASIGISGCKKLIEVDPPVNNISSGNLYTSDATAADLLTGLYIKMSRENAEFNVEGYVATAFNVAGLSSDELSLFDAEFSGGYYNLYAKNELTTVQAPGFWKNIYLDLFIVNSAIEGISKSSSLTLAVKEQLLGEAKFMRAFYLFYLVNFYGEIPLVITTDYTLNRQLPRAAKSEIYQQMTADLKEAQLLLRDEYKAGDAISIVADRVRPNKATASALLARVYLYQASEGNNSWSEAEEEASKVIVNSAYDTVPLSAVFLNSSKEAIWQLQPVGAGVNGNTGQGKFFVLPETQNLSYPVYLSNTIVNSFESGDKRKTEWVGTVTYDGTSYSFPNKYKIGQDMDLPSTEYSTVFRLAEQYLIRAEARAHLGDVAGAQSDLNVIRTRAGLPNTAADDESSLLAAIEQERKVELFTECGHRWFDLKRTNKAHEVLSVIKGTTWQTTDQLYPIPAREIAKTPALQGHQNPGYQ